MTDLSPLARRAARWATDWVDLQFSLMIASLREVAPRARGRLLDVGCGDKPYEHLFAPHVSEYIGVEHESSFSTTSAATRARPDCVYVGSRLPFPAESFDTILCAQVLEHTPRPAELVAEMGRVLRTDGLLILVAPFSFRLHEEPHDYFRYTPHGLTELCARAGLEVFETHAQGTLWSLIGHKLNSYLGLRVARVSRVAQELGKLGHETSAAEAPRLWTFPLVGPAMLSIAACARLMDRAFPEPNEMLSVLVLARKAPRGPAGAPQ